MSKEKEVTKEKKEKKEKKPRASKQEREQASTEHFGKCVEVARRTIKCNDIHTHEKGFYATLKRGKRMIVIVRRRAKGATVVVWRGDNKNSPALDLPVGTSGAEMSRQIVEFIKTNPVNNNGETTVPATAEAPEAPAQPAAAPAEGSSEKAE